MEGEAWAASQQQLQQHSSGLYTSACFSTFGNNWTSFRCLAHVHSSEIGNHMTPSISKFGETKDAISRYFWTSCRTLWSSRIKMVVFRCLSRFWTNSNTMKPSRNTGCSCSLVLTILALGYRRRTRKTSSSILASKMTILREISKELASAWASARRLLKKWAVLSVLNRRKTRVANFWSISKRNVCSKRLIWTKKKYKWTQNSAWNRSCCKSSQICI